MRKKNNIIVGLTTFDNEMLRVSVPMLGKIRQKFILIIYNDNPMTTITRRQIRRLGYCGDLRVINTNENMGLFRARMEIVNAAHDLDAGWIIFCDDDDLLMDIEIPNVSDDNFAIIQNALILHHRVGDLLRAMNNPSEIDVDGENVELARPYVAMAGTPVRADILFGVAHMDSGFYDAIKKLDDKLEFVPPVDAMMWRFVNAYAHHMNANCAPIYMDKIGYIKNKLDTVRMKYGRLTRPARNVDEHYRRVLDKYDAIFRDALSTAAALRG